MASINKNQFIDQVDNGAIITYPFYTYNLPLPLPLLILVLILAYLILVIIGLIVRRTLRQRNLCVGEGLCGREGETSCPCCLSMAESCNCCQAHSLEACLNNLCPQRKTHDCADLFLCQICTNRGGEDPSCGWINCDCIQSEYCEDSTCLCFRCNFRAIPLVNDPNV